MYINKVHQAKFSKNEEFANFCIERRNKGHTFMNSLILESVILSSSGLSVGNEDVYGLKLRLNLADSFDKYLQP